MKEFKGSKGAWYIDFSGVGSRWNIDDENGNSIAISHQLSYDKDYVKRDANTKLIAAAPELLWALQEIIDCNEGITLKEPGWDFELSLTKAREVIKKALGE